MEQGNLNWRAVLDRIDPGRIRKIIIEVSSIKYVGDSHANQTPKQTIDQS